MLTLLRYNSTALQTQGILFDENDHYIKDTLELPWRDNAHFISCIPVGTYRIRWSTGVHEVGDCYEVLDVPSRDGILIHPANMIRELKGCIAPGERFGSAVMYSVDALQALHAVAGNEAELVIKEYSNELL